jgi:hypothetical protein
MPTPNASLKPMTKTGKTERKIVKLKALIFDTLFARRDRSADRHAKARIPSTDTASDRNPVLAIFEAAQ